jgi:hypothetical protein
VLTQTCKELREKIVNRSKRTLLAFAPAAGLVLPTAEKAFAQSSRVDEKDANALALGYKHDALTVDTKKYPQYAKGSICANCTLYVGKPSAPWAACGAVGGKQVNAKGWCVAYAKTA